MSEFISNLSLVSDCFSVLGWSIILFKLGEEYLRERKNKMKK